jgi:hypothetical protein
VVFTGRTGEAARTVSRANAEWRHEFEQTLPDLTDDDIAGSGFAITSYTVHRDLGGDVALARLRERLRQRGLKLMLDFVPNHMAPDHPWVGQHPDYFAGGSEIDLARAPRNYFRVPATNGSGLFAHGRDPYFPGWPDTIQLNYGNPALREAMIGELSRTPGQCDGVRCDMAMLVPPEVFRRTWDIESQPFWPRAIPRVREQAADFVFMAEVYWDLEWASPSLRLACASSIKANSRAAKNASPHTSSARFEPIDTVLSQFYSRLLAVLRHPAVRQGNWQLLD